MVFALPIGYSICAFIADRRLRFALAAIVIGSTGYAMLDSHHGRLSNEIADAIDRIRTVPPDGELVKVGRALGISFGSE